MAPKKINLGTNQTWLLVKNRLLAQTGLNTFRYEKDSRKKSKKIMMFSVIALLAVMAVVYVTVLAIGYAQLGLNELTPGIALIVSSLITLFFTIFTAKGELFAHSDYDLLMSLPISTRKVVNSRFLNMYLWNTLFSLLVMLPMGIVYAAFAQVSFSFYPLWLLGILLSSLIPTTLAAVFGAVITAFSVKFKYATLVATLLSFAAAISILVFSMSISQASSSYSHFFDASGQPNLVELKALAPIISAQFNRFYPPAYLFAKGIVNQQLGYFLLFASLSLVWYLAFVEILAWRYPQINTALTSHQSRGNYQFRESTQKGMVSALYKKTSLRILKSTVATTNLLMGCVMALLASGMLLFVGLDKVLIGLELSQFLPLIKNAAPFMIAAMVSMTNTTSISLALEGKTIWLIRSLPIPPKKLYLSYVLVNLSFTVPTAILSSLMMCLALKTTFFETVVMFTTPLVFTVALAVLGIMIGNRLAYYDWQEETQLIKQSLMSMLGMLGGLVIIGLSALLVNLPFIPVEPLVLTFSLCLLVSILTVGLFIRESQRPIKA